MTKADEARRLVGFRPIAVLAMVAIVLAAGPAVAQIPDEFENLKVLPQDIEKRQLVGIMKNFCSSLGVRCWHCHVGEEGKPLSEFDFVSDEKPAKEISRVMMRMAGEINNTFLPQTGRKPPELLEVRCATCHRGQARPQTLEQVLAGVVAEDGIEPALARYQELREQHYGSATFDFSVGTLVRLATRLAGGDKVPEAIAFLELNNELYPKAGMSYFTLGEIHMKNGDKGKATESFEKVLELNPKNPIAKRRLEQLKGD